MKYLVFNFNFRSRINYLLPLLFLNFNQFHWNSFLIDITILLFFQIIIKFKINLFINNKHYNLIIKCYSGNF